MINRNSALTNGLAARGHNVTVLSPDIDKNAPKGVHYILMEGLYNEAYHEIVKGFFTFQSEMNPLTAPIEFNDFFYGICTGLCFVNRDPGYLSFYLFR